MDIKTNESLLAALRQASSHTPTADELKEQRVSFIMGTLKEESGVTRAKIEAVLAEQEGRKAS